MEDSGPPNSRPTAETTMPLAVEKVRNPAGAQLVALLDDDVHLPHTEEVPTDLAAEVANGPPVTVVLEVANHLGAPACPWAPRAGTPVPGPSAAHMVALLSAETELDHTLLRSKAAELPASFPVVAQTG